MTPERIAELERWCEADPSRAPAHELLAEVKRLNHQIFSMSCHVQGMEAEMRRATDVLPNDWETKRFWDYVHGFEKECSTPGTECT